MPNYQKGKIYKIVTDASDDVYIGSTTKERLNDRLSVHNCYYKKYIAGEKYNFSVFKVIGQGNYKIVLLENYPCNERKELDARERYWIQKTPCVNKNIPCRTDQEYRDDTKEKRKQWYYDNWEKLHEKRIEQYNPEKKKKYQQEHKEEIKKQRKQFYEENKERLAKEKFTVFECLCGKPYTRSHKARHEQTKRHQEWEKKQK
jgi:hypothetical protein